MNVHRVTDLLARLRNEWRFRAPPRRVRPVLAGVAILAMAFAIGVWVVMPSLTWHVLQNEYAEGADRQLDVADIDVNPFTLTVRFSGLTMIDPHSQAQFSARRVDVNFHFTTLFGHSPILDSLVLDTPRWQFDLRPNGDVKTPADALDAVLEGIRRQSSLRIAELRVIDGSVKLVDKSTLARAVTFSHLTVMATTFGTSSASPGQYTLTANVGIGAHEDGTLKLEGQLSAAPFTTSGKLALAGLHLEGVVAWGDTRLASLAPRGSVGVTARYHLSAPAGGDREWVIEKAQGKIDGLQVNLAPGLMIDENHVAIASLEGASTRTGARSQATLLFGAKTSATLAVGWSSVVGGQRNVHLHAANLTTSALSKYSQWALGKGLASGEADVDLDYAVDGASARGDFALHAHDIRLANSAANLKDANTLELALALLANPMGEVELRLPISAHFADASADADGQVRPADPLAAEPREERSAGGATVDSIAEAVATTLRNRLQSFATNPFQTLAMQVDAGVGDLRTVVFEPGTATPTAVGLQSLKALADALRVRPRVGLIATGGFDAKADRHALAAEEIRLHVALATAGATLNVTPGPIDFTSPRDQSVLSEFAGQRLTAERRATVASEVESGADQPGSPHAASYYRALFDALVAETKVSPAALARLGRFRAQAIAGFLAKEGVASERITTGDGNATLSGGDSGVAIPLEIRLANVKP